MARAPEPTYSQLNDFIQEQATLLAQAQHLARSAERSMNHTADHIIRCLRDAFPREIQIKYNGMAWPTEPTRHVTLLIEWLQQPKIRKRLPLGWLQSTNLFNESGKLSRDTRRSSGDVERMEYTHLFTLTDEESTTDECLSDDSDDSQPICCSQPPPTESQQQQQSTSTPPSSQSRAGGGGKRRRQ